MATKENELVPFGIRFAKIPSINVDARNPDRDDTPTEYITDPNKKEWDQDA